MNCKGFVVAMRAEVSPLAYDRPHLPTDGTGRDWLIVSRWGEASEYLTISSAAEPLGLRSEDTAEAGARPAPIALHPRRTWFGVLTPDHRGPESIFLLNRDLPKDVPVAGSFAPAEGYVRLTTGADGTLQLVAVAREVPEDEPALQRGRPGKDGSQAAWHLIAERRPWLGEVVDAPAS